MAFSKGQSPNPRGRPRGSKTTVKINVNTQRAVIRQLSERAKHGEQAAVDSLAQIMARYGSASTD